MSRSFALRLGAPMAVLMAVLLTSSFKGPNIDEYQVKAVFIINFAKYVDWSSHREEDDFKIGIVGQSEIKEELEKIAEYKKGSGRSMQVMQLDPEKPIPCNIVFVAHSESRRVQKLAKDFAGKGVLLVSEDNKSASRAAGINLIKTDNKIKFEINQTSIKYAGLRLSSQLQLLASALHP
jgi:YfiR/HmsC-like